MTTLKPVGDYSTDPFTIKRPELTTCTNWKNRSTYCTWCGRKMVVFWKLLLRYDSRTGERKECKRYICPNYKWYRPLHDKY